MSNAPGHENAPLAVDAVRITTIEVNNPVTATTVTSYYHTDHLGSPVAATNELGALIFSERYAPFGESGIETSTESKTVGSIGYTGHLDDADLGLTYMEARYYDPLIGRFYANDPVGFIESNPSSFNRFAYGNNSPYQFIDPDGREPTKSQAATWVQVRAIIQGIEKKGLHDLRYTKKAAGGGGQVGPFGGAKGPRYIWTKKRGWIDLAHMLQVASEAQINIGNGIGKTIAKGPGRGYAKGKLWDKTVDVENSQGSAPTSWSYEDAPSNLAGLDFFLDYYTNDDSIFSALDNFFADSEASNPSEAPNWSSMQQTEDHNNRWFQQNKSFTPALNPEEVK